MTYDTFKPKSLMKSAIDKIEAFTLSGGTMLVPNGQMNLLRSLTPREVRLITEELDEP